MNDASLNRLARRTRISVAAAAVALAFAGPALAEPVALRDAPRANAIALAGEDVVITRTDRRGTLHVEAVGPGPARSLLVARHARAWGLDASPEWVAVLSEREAGGDTAGWRIHAGPPTGPLSTVLDVPVGRRVWIPIGVDVDGRRIIVTEIHLADFSTRARVLAPPLAPQPLPWSGVLFDARLAGEHAAFVGSTRPDPGRTARVFVTDARTGAVEASMRVDPDVDIEDGEFDLRADGRAVAATGGRLITAAPGEAQHLVAPGAFNRPRFAGDSLLALRRGRQRTSRPVVVDGLRPLGPRSTDIRGLAANGSAAAWLANGCVLYAPLASVTGSTPAAGPCPRTEVVVEGGQQRVRAAAVRTVITCVAAAAGVCRGTVMLRAGGRTRGRSDFALAAGGRRSVVVPLNRSGRRFLRSGLRREIGGAYFALRARVVDGRVSSSVGDPGVFVVRRR